LRFRIEQGPKWLSIHPETGELSGKPDRVGRDEVVIAVTLERELRLLDPGQLQWGVEKTIQSGTETVGTAKQSFVIETKP